jgi:hypothetical protein
MARFEYKTTYVPVSYDADVAESKRGKVGKLLDSVFDSKPMPANPDPDSLIDNREYESSLREMGDDGWELVSVQPLLRASHTVVNSPSTGQAGLSSSVTAGYYLFWKRAVQDHG